MKIRSLILALLLMRFSATAQPISLYPANPHYFLYNGKPTVLITSGEHYGIVINGTPDYKKYLDVLQRHHFNLTRVFVGSYCESNYYEGHKGRTLKWEEEQNTLAVRPGKLLVPWARSNVPGYVNGGNKFDLNHWDSHYFRRLQDFCRQASTRGIVVEIVFFSANYGPSNWKHSPLQKDNNINLTRDIAYNEIYFSENRDLIRYQLAMVRKIVKALNEFDNVYFEICNEPYWLKGIPEVEPSVKEQQMSDSIYEWEKNIALAVKETEYALQKKHLVAQNFANTYLKIKNPDSNVSILNFHYAYPPKTVTDNYALNKPVSFDETADGLNASGRRREAWPFMLAGGAVYDNLDWSFANDDMTGMGLNPQGKRLKGEAVWKQLEILQQALQQFDFAEAKPVEDIFRQGLPDGVSLYGLGLAGKDYLLYWQKTKKVSFAEWDCPVPEGRYSVQWMDPANGHVAEEQIVQSKNNRLQMKIPPFEDDQVLHIQRVK